jgi:sortase A
VSLEPPAAGSAGGARVTPLGTRRTSVEDLQREVERLTAALQLAEQRRVTAERTLADVARMAAANAADLRDRIAALEEAAARPRPPVAVPIPRPAAPPAGPRTAGLRRTVWRTTLVLGLVLGVLLIVDGLLTIAWQEPVTAIMQSRSQAALNDDLARLNATFADAPRLQRETDAGRMRREAGALLHARKPGAALGHIDIPRIGLHAVFVESTQHDALTKGPGHYLGTVLPGMAGVVGLAGHRTTYGAPFRHVDNLPRGTRIDVRMPYGRFIYRVTGTEITTPNDASLLRSQPGVHRLVLTACHPLYSATKRIVVSARQVYAEPV